MVEEEDLPLMFREEACKRFAKVQCQDHDLLYISEMIDYPVASVGICLRVDEKVISETEKDKSCPKLKNKVHKLLSEWQRKNTGNATWAKLIGCLQSLNDRKLMEHIKTHLSQMEYLTKGMLVTCFNLSVVNMALCMKLMYVLVPRFCIVRASTPLHFTLPPNFDCSVVY